MRFNDLQDWLYWIESCHPSEIELGLERMGQVYQRLNCCFNNTKIITVAGTNGKGSCVAVLEHLLLKQGLRVGCYTSPHFLRYNERVKILGSEVEDELLVAAFDKIDRLRGDTPLTYFEYGTLAGLDIFSNLNLDVVILEVGLGGRLDASNIVDADIAVVTNIDVDHEDWLGSDVEVIGREKSGIFRSGKIAICGDPNPPGSVQQTAEALGSIFYQRDKDFTVIRQKDRINFTGTVPGGISCHITQLPIPDLPFDSVVAAIQVGLLMGLPVDPVFYQSLSNLGLTGRFQLLKHQSKSIILDVAHNPAAAEHLAKKLQKSVSSGSFTGKTYAVAAMMADKDVTAIISPMVEAVDCWYLGNLPSPRALSADNLRSVLIEQGVNSAHLKHNIPAAFQQAKAEMSEHDRLVVFGSFFTVAEVLDLMASDNDNVAGGIDAG